jgi:hypothetical protein
LSALAKATTAGRTGTKRKYEALVRTLISPERVALWKRCEESWRPKRTGIYDWKLSLIALKKELDDLKA